MYLSSRKPHTKTRDLNIGLSRKEYDMNNYEVDSYYFFDDFLSSSKNISDDMTC